MMDSKESQSAHCGFRGCLMLIGAMLLGTIYSQAQSVAPDFAPVITRGGSLINVVAVRSDGKCMIAGDFCAVGGHEGWGVARLHTDGSVDKNFRSELAPFRAPSITSQLGHAFSAMALEAHGSVIFSGSAVGGGLARLDSNGRMDKSFVADIFAATSIVIQPAGKLLVAGNFTAVNGLSRHGAVLLNRDGSLDPSFIVPDEVSTPISPILATQSDGRILLAGSGAYNSPLVVRLLPEGVIDKSFSVTNTGTQNSQIFSLAQQRDGRIILAGNFDSINGTALGDIVRLNEDGTVDPSFQSIPDLEGFNVEINTVLLQADGKVLISGLFDKLYGQRTPRLARLNNDGSLDTSFQPDTLVEGGILGNLVNRLVPLSEDRLLLFGMFRNFGTNPVPAVVRIGSDGRRDQTFRAQPEGKAKVFNGTLQPDGKILIVGDFDYVNGEPRPQIARLNPDATLDPSFSPPLLTREKLLSIALQRDGKVLIGGEFTDFSAPPWKGVGRLLPDGRLDDGFTFTNRLAARCCGVSVKQISALPEGKILLGGSFIRADDTPLNSLARLESDGRIDQSFQAHRTNWVEIFNFAALSDGKIVAALKTTGGQLLRTA